MRLHTITTIVGALGLLAISFLPSPVLGQEKQANVPVDGDGPVPVAASPSWQRAMPTGPVSGTKVTEKYAELVTRTPTFGRGHS